MSGQVINWTWSNSKDDYVGFWPVGTTPPGSLLTGSELKTRTKTSFSEGKEVFFAPLKEYQPITWAKLQTLDLFLVQDKTYPNLVDIVAPSNDLIVFVEPFKTGDELRNWDEIFSLLPSYLHGYYSNFNGMRASYVTLGRPVNLPSAVGNWRRVSDYRKEQNLKKSVLKKMEAELGDPEKIWIFIETESNDLLMLNGNTIDKKIYVAPEANFENFYELESPASKIDSLCAHIISGALDPYYIK